MLLLGVDETPSLPILWSLARRGVPVTVASSRRICAGMLSRYPVRRCLYPDPVKEPAGFVEWIRGQVRSGGYPVTLGCGEEVTYLLSKHRPELAPHTSIPIVDFETFVKCRDKSLTMKAAAECGVPIPATWYPEVSGIEAVLGQATYPALVKPCVGEGARGISLVDSKESLRRTYHDTRERFGPCIVQEFIPHDDMQYKVDLLLDRQSRVRVGGTYVKLRYYPPQGGSSILSQPVLREDILDRAARLMTHIRWVGMADTDFIVDPRDGVAKLMEVNPRFPRSFRVLVEAGLDFPYELYRLALGLEPREVRRYRTDLFVRYLPMELAWFVRSPDRFRARPSFFRFFSANVRYEEWSLRDPLVGVGLWASLLTDMLDPVKRKWRWR